LEVMGLSIFMANVPDFRYENMKIVPSAQLPWPRKKSLKHLVRTEKRVPENELDDLR